jgi:hypothetical protein
MRRLGTLSALACTLAFLCRGSSTYLAGSVGTVTSFISSRRIVIPAFDPDRASLRCYQLQGEENLPFSVSNDGDDEIIDFSQDSTGFCVVAPRLAEQSSVGTTVSVKDFGAIGDGKADDYSAMLAAATYICGSGGTLVYPPGTYYVARFRIIGGPSANGVENITYRGCQNVTVVGYGAKIIVNGSFTQHADFERGTDTYSYTNTVIPFDFIDSRRFTVAGFEIDGGARSMRRDKGVVESAAHGIRTSQCSDYVLAHLNVHHSQTDGLCIGCGTRADRNAYIFDVKATNNARMGLTIAQTLGALVDSSSFKYNGRTDGDYAGHPPAAGVDVEPNFAPPITDVKTGGLAFVLCHFEENLGLQFVAASARAIDSITVTGSVVRATQPYVSLGGAYLNVARRAITELSSFEMKQFVSVVLVTARDHPDEICFRGNKFELKKASGVVTGATAPIPGRFVFNQVLLLASAADNHVLNLRNLAQVGCNTFFASAVGRYPFYRDQLEIDYFGSAVVVGNRYETDLHDGAGGFYVNYANTGAVDDERFADAARFGPLPRLTSGQNWFSTVPPIPPGSRTAKSLAGVEMAVCSW